MHLRRLLLPSWGLCLLLLFGNCTSPISDRPNILLINIDDMGWRDLSIQGSQYYETPHLDSLARHGMIFTNGYAAAANCAPSRASLMTGLWTTRHGIYTVGSSERGASKDRRLIPTKNITRLDERFVTVAEVLQDAGYATCQAGKWHLSKDPKPYGFDLSIGGGHNGHPSSYYPPYGNVDLLPPNEEYLTDFIMTRTLTFIDSVSRPFFLYYSPYAVHTPIQPVHQLLPKYENKSSWNGQANADYATMVENLDRNIGRLIARLEATGQMDNTLIIFTSDNGGLFGITQQKPLRAGKGSYYEGGIRVPFFFHWAGRIAVGARSNEPMTHLDLFPTILDAADIVDFQQELDGVNLLPHLLGESEIAERTLFWHFPIYLQAYNPRQNENRDLLFRTRPGAVIMKGMWKLHYYFEDRGIELYDLSQDIGEQHNLADTEPAQREELLAILRDWWSDAEAPIPAEPNPDFIPQER
ncbi:MAG: sulfatase [Bacteroidota bacterium]